MPGRMGYLWLDRTHQNSKTYKYLYAGAELLIYILSSAGIIYLLLNTRRLLKALFSRKMTLKDEVLIPCLNTAFFLAVYFVFEGQARYNYPLLFLFAISLFIIMHKTSDGLRSE